MKTQLIKKLAREGILLSPKMLERLDESMSEELLKKHNTNGPVVVCDDEEKESNNMKIEVRRFSSKKKLSVEDFTSYYNRRYKKIMEMLLKKGKAVSINNAKKSFSDVSVIGMVREPTGNGFIMDDMTGDMEVVSKNRPEANDVVMVKGAVKENRLFSSEIIHPDIPLDNSVSRMPNSSLYLYNGSEPTEKPKGSDFMISTEGIKKTPACQFTSEMTNPAWIYLHKGSQTIKVLVYRMQGEPAIKTIMNYVRRRHLFPKESMIRGTDDPYLIDPVPDIFWVPAKNNGHENYKGMTIISGKNVKINLNTREVDFF